jgi:hypothetical protein
MNEYVERIFQKESKTYKASKCCPLIRREDRKRQLSGRARWGLYQ